MLQERVWATCGVASPGIYGPSGKPAAEVAKYPKAPKSHSRLFYCRRKVLNGLVASVLPAAGKPAYAGLARTCSLCGRSHGYRGVVKRLDPRLILVCYLRRRASVQYVDPVLPAANAAPAGRPGEPAAGEVWQPPDPDNPKTLVQGPITWCVHCTKLLPVMAL